MGGMSAQHAEKPSVFPSITSVIKPAVESWTLTEADVNAWLKQAHQGDVLRYAVGPTLIQGAAAARIRQLIGSQDVVPLPQRRNAAGGFDYRVARNRVRVVKQRPAKLDAGMAAVLAKLEEAADAKARCPSDAELGQALGGSADQVKWAIKKLRAARFIQTRVVATQAAPKFRVVTICRTGAETALPDGVAQ